MSTIRGITVQIGADTTALTAALRDVNDASYKIGKELKDIEKMLKFNPGDTELLAQKQKLLGDQIATTSEKLNRLREVQEQVNEQFQKGEMPEEQHRAFQREIVKTESQLKNYEKQLRAVNLENNEFKQSMDRLGKSLDEAGKKMAAIGSDLTKKLTVPLAGIGAIATKIGMDFESAMSKVQAASGASAKDMEMLEKAARDAGASTSKSATDAADALGYMALAGWDTKTSVEGLMPVLRLSEAGNIDLARASSLVTDSMSAMGIQVQDLGGYLDTIAQTARNSNTNIDQMAEAYIKVGGTLRGLNVPIEESSVALGMMANAGIKGSEAGAGLNAILLNLTAPAGRAKEALADLGYSAFDAEGNFKGLDQVLFDLKALTADMSEEQRNLTLAMIGGKNHTKDLNALLNGLDDSYGDLKQAVMGADGALNDMAETMLDNTKGSLVQLRSALEELALKIYDVMQPAIRGLIDAIRGFVGWLDQLNPAVQRTVIVIAGIAAAIGPVLIIFGKLATGAGAVITAFGTLSAFITAKLVPAIMAINWPVVAAVGAIVGLATVAYEVYRAWDEVKAALVATWDLLKASAVQLGLNIAIAMEEMKHATLNAVSAILERLTVLERIPFGIGEKFVGLKDSVADGVDGSTTKLEELRKSAEENSARIATAVENTKVAFGDLGAKVAEDVKLAIGKITGATEAEAQELEEQTEVIDTELEKQLATTTKYQTEQTAVVNEEAEERTEIISKEAQKQAEERAKFEQSWTDKLFKLTADRLAQLDRELKQELEKAEQLGADKTSIVEYYAIKRQEILDEEVKKEAEREQKRIDTLAKFEQDWAKRLFEQTASKLEILESEKQDVLRQAEELGAQKADILRYYAILEQEILDEQHSDEQRKNQERLDTLAGFQRQWADKLFQATASNLEILEREKQEALTKAEELGANKTTIIEYYALKQQEILDEQLKTEREREQQRIDNLIAFEESWAKKVFEQSATRLELLEAEKQAALAKAEEIGADKTRILNYYAKEEQRILEELEKERQKLREQEIQAEQAKLDTKENQLRQWEKRLFEQTSSELEILEAKKNEELALAEKLGLDKTSIIEYYANEQQKILDKQIESEQKELDRLAKETAKIAEEKEKARVDFEQSWNRKLFRATADRLDILRSEQREALKQAEELGASKLAILEYYANEEQKLLEQRREEEQRVQDEELQRVREVAEEQKRIKDEFEQSWSDRLFDLTATPEMRLEKLKQEAEAVEEQAKKIEASAETIQAIQEYYAKKQAQLQEKIAEDQMSTWERLKSQISDPVEKLQEAVYNAGRSMLEFAGHLKAGSFKQAILGVLMETEAFARGMELIGKIMEPIIALFDAVLAPMIKMVATLLMKVANFFIDAINGVFRVLNKIPFVNIKYIDRVEWDKDLEKQDPKDKPKGGSGGSQVSEITGPTRDLFMDLLAPLANLSQIVAPLQDIRSILDARLPNFDNLALAGVGGNINITIAPGAVVVQGSPSGKIDMDKLSSDLAKKLMNEIRGRGGR